jgi:prepilin peptidase CpaA
MKISADNIYAVGALLFALAAAGWDVRTRRIPNWMTLPGIVLGLLMHGIISGWMGLASAAAAAAVAGSAFLVLFIAGGMGAGDVKLITAVSAIAGWPAMPAILLGTVLTGGVLALGMAIWRGRLRATLMNVAKLATHHGQHGLVPHPEVNVLNARTLRLPYGVAIAAGCLIPLMR